MLVPLTWLLCAPALTGEGEPPTYARDVAPILQRRCQMCHRPGQVGPFPLLSFEDARGRAKMIAQVVERAAMPPWNADERFDGVFVNQRTLSTTEKQTLASWVAAGMPRGNPAEEPAPRQWPAEWSIGKPDAVFAPDTDLKTQQKLPADGFAVPREGVVEYQYFTVKTDFPEDRWVKAFEIHPGSPDVVHHVLVTLQSANGFLDDKSFLATYVPGDTPSIYPEGYAKRLPKGATLLFQVHYTPNGVEQKDQSELGLIFAKEPPKEIADTVGILAMNLRIPPGAESYKSSRSFTVPVNATVYSYSPHMHVRGKAFRISATYPDGKQEILLSVPKYDFNWQTRYMLKEPKKVPAGTKILIEAWYDNSSKNPHNPDPTKLVTWGEQTFEEMMIGFIDVVSEGNKTQQLRMQNFLGGLGQRRRTGQ